jgi:DNA-binding NarL/FixJ family response regulator
VSGPACSCGQRRLPGEADIRVLVVDDHPMVRASLSELLSDEHDLTVVGECADGSEVVEAVERLRPDVVLMDLSMPGMDGLAATEAVRAVRPDQRVVVFTGDGTGARPDVQAAGANALVPKSARADALLGCVRTLVAGCSCCPYCL